MSITLIIIAITAVVSFGALNNPELFSKLLFQPFVMHDKDSWYRFISHGFVHGSIMHLAVNMYVLWMFGTAVEDAYAIGTGMPHTVYLVLYLGGIVLSSIPGYFKHRHDPEYRAVGASGATSAVVFSFILLHPDTKLMLIFLPIPMAAWIFGGLYLAYEWYMSKKGRDGIAHDAHYFGALFGIAFTAIIIPGTVSHFINAVGF
ncbi:MAG: rhomboid family intramembrane serine protease [Flavobacteriales bacterium]|jgi:membrane associated rhomboid family serine protease|nr:rhomboid family intramembrane serine protease [Flavobacteriales bacterium]MCI1753356.1 rhomboid family intramembrane serine protease [Flavobacteriales bacterium]